MTIRQTLCILLFLLPAIGFAQKEILISEMDKPMSTGNNNCYVLLIPQARGKDVTDDWKKYIRKDTKAKPEEDGGEIKILGAVNKNIGTAPLNIYARIMETADGVQISVWIAAAGEAFISSAKNADKSVAVQKYLHDFGVQEYKEAVKRELEVEQKKSKELEKVYDGFVKDQKKAESNIDNHNKEIKKLQDKIKEEEANIAKAQSSQGTSRADADKQKGAVQQVTDKMNNIK